jgi:integrase
MATYTKLQNGKIKARIRWDGKQKSKNFNNEQQARAWARAVEFDLGILKDRRHLLNDFAPDAFDRDGLYVPVNMRELLLKYLKEETPKKRSAAQETQLIKQILTYDWVNLSTYELRRQTFNEFRDSRLKQVKVASVRRMFDVIRSAMNHAKKEWEWNVPVDAVTVKMPKTDTKVSVQRISQETIDRLVDAARKANNDYLADLIVVAVETGLRRGEFTKLRWSDVDLDNGVISVRETKTGYDRDVVLTEAAKAVLRVRKRDLERVFPVTEEAISQSWKRTRKRAGVAGVRFHDLRHEAISRFFELGLTSPEVQEQSGHQTMSQLDRYSHGSRDRIAAKLRGEQS